MPSAPSTRLHTPNLLVVDHAGLRVVLVSLLVCIGAAIAYLITQQDIIWTTQVGLIVGYLVGIPVLLSSNYDRSILLMFAFASVAGLLKYKTDFNPVIHVTLDIMMALICLGWFIRRMFALRTGPPVRTPLAPLIAVFVAVCVLQIFNPLSYSYYASVAALKMHIFMIPLFFFGYHYLQSIRQIRLWVVSFALIGIMMGIVSIDQYIKGPEQMIEEMPEYAWMIERNTWQDSSGRSFFRPMSTTSNPGGASTWMQCIIPLVFAACMFGSFSRRMKIWLTAALIFLIATLMISLIRQMWMVTVFSLVFMLFLQFRSGRVKHELMFIVLLVGAGVLGWRVASGVMGGGEPLQELIDIIINPFDAFQSNRGVFLSMIPLLMRFYPLGAGLGRTGPAAAKFSQEIYEYQEMYGGPGPMVAENYFLAMLSETGIPGTVLICLFTIALLWKGYKTYLSIQNSDLKWASAAMLGVIFSIFIVFFGGPALVTAPLNLYFWFLGGAMLKLPELDRQMREKRLINFDHQKGQPL